MRFEIKGTFSQEFAEKFQALAQQVNDGNTEAMGTLAATLKDESPEAALLLYRQAAELGDAKAMVDLGLMLQKSGGIEEARQWWLLAADLGNPKAMVCVGDLVAKAQPDEARRWYEEAAKLGNVHAMERLATLVMHHDPDLANKWFELAVSKGSLQAMHNFAVFLRSRQPERSKELWRQAAEAGFQPSIAALASASTRRTTPPRWAKRRSP
ncbi:MAG: tetratricopeptide repeat protein [Acidimicrobiales bacterium]